MIDWDPARLAQAAGARLSSAGERERAPGPRRVVIDSRELAPGDLFVGLPGRHQDGGRHAAAALEDGAWGVLVAERHADTLDRRTPGAVLVHRDPLAGLQQLASSWRARLKRHGTRVIAVTGSTGKTSTKDILAALGAGSLRTASSPQNLNTEIGLPLAILAAGAEVELLVLELAMRGPGQIAALTQIAEPDVGVILNIGPVHLGLLGSLEAIAAAKAELIAGLAPGATIVLPAQEPLLDPHRRADLRTITFGEGGDVTLGERSADGTVTVRDRGDAITLRPSFSQSHNLRNLLAAVAALRALGVTPAGEVSVNFSALRGERIQLERGIVLINDCYNANPISMRAALEELAQTAPARRVAVLGDMLELGADAEEYHRRLGQQAAEHGVELLVTVGPLAAAMGQRFPGELHSLATPEQAAGLLEGLLEEQDTVLVKGSRGVGLELISSCLQARQNDRRGRYARHPGEGG